MKDIGAEMRWNKCNSEQKLILFLAHRSGEKEEKDIKIYEIGRLIGSGLK